MNTNKEVSVPASEFINVQVIAAPTSNPNVYAVTCNPESITVRARDTIINYQIVAPTPEGVQFVGVEVRPDHNHQFSQPSISISGKLLTFSDANTVKETLDLTLRFIDRDGNNFGFDPQVQNEPY